MHEILEAFGIDWRLIVIQIFNFAVLVGVLWYFLYTPVLKLLSEREAKIKKGVDDALKAEAALATADTEKVRVLKEAHAEASHIVERATKHAEEKGALIIEEAHGRSAREAEKAKHDAAEIKNRAIKESEAEITKLALLATERILTEKLEK